jgi:hypothetical protein
MVSFEELLPSLVSPEWVEERKIRWGVNNPTYQSKVLGEFPDISDDSLILPKWIEAAQKRTLESTSTRMTTSSRPSSDRSSGASTPAVGSRSNRRTTCASEACRHRIGLMRWPSPSLARANAAPMNVESHAGEGITGDLMTKAW